LNAKPVGIVIVLDDCPIYVREAAKAALAAGAHWLPIEWLPKYAPELNEVENAWHASPDIRRHSRASLCYVGLPANFLPNDATPLL
jgi:transposase